MTVKEIMGNAQYISGQFISLPVALRLINNAVDILATRYDTATPTDSILRSTFNAKANEPCPLPEEYIGVTKVTLNGHPYTNYTISEDNIIFKDAGEFIVSLQLMPGPVEAESDEPNIPIPYHSIIELYIASRVVRPLDQNLEQRFYMMADQINTRLQCRKRKSLHIPARVWR
mgnify:CR=1 FL=1